MKLIVGLGNPGPKYRGTRHNIGFAVIDELARRGGLEFESAPVDALLARWRRRETLLAKPLTFMNASGEAVGGLVRYFKIDPADLLIVVDEVQLPLGRLRARARGSKARDTTSGLRCSTSWRGGRTRHTVRRRSKA